MQYVTALIIHVMWKSHMTVMLSGIKAAHLSVKFCRLKLRKGQMCVHRGNIIHPVVQMN